MRMQEPYEKGVAIRSASSLALGIARYTAKRRQRPVSRELPVDPYRDHRWGFPCCVWSPMPTCRRHYPGRFNGAYSLVCLHCQRPSPSAPAIVFSGPAQRSLTLRPARSRSRQAPLYIESSDSFVASAAASIATGWSEPVPGRELHPLKSSAFHGALFRQPSRSEALDRPGLLPHSLIGPFTGFTPFSFYTAISAESRRHPRKVLNRFLSAFPSGMPDDIDVGFWPLRRGITRRSQYKE